MNVTEPLINREDVGLWAHWWVPTGAGVLALGIAFTTTSEGVRPHAWQIGLFSFGTLMALIDGLGSLQVISYGTVGGPDERRNEASARFFVWQRARWRYLTASIVGTLSALGTSLVRSDMGTFTALMAAWALYFVVWAIDVFRSLKEAKVLFPPRRD